MAAYPLHTHKTSNGYPTQLTQITHTMAVYPSYTNKTANGCPTHFTDIRQVTDVHPPHTHKSNNGCSPLHLTHLRYLMAAYIPYKG